MIKYRTRNWNIDIEEVEITSETDKFYYIKKSYGGTEKINTGERKESSYHRYHDTKEAAIRHLIDKHRIRIERANNEIKEASRNIAKLDKLLEGLKK